MSELTTNECKHGGRMHDQKIASRTQPRITPQTQFFSCGAAGAFGLKISDLQLHAY